MKRKLINMKRPEQVPREEVLLAVCEVYDVQVYMGSSWYATHSNIQVS